MRPQNSTNKKLKYILKVNVQDEEVHYGYYPSLREISKELNMPYHTISDYYEGRRNSFGRFKDCKYFPTISINKIEE